MADTNGYSLASVGEKSTEDHDVPPKKSASQLRANLRGMSESNGNLENGDIPMSILSASSPKPTSPRKRVTPKPIEIPSYAERSPDSTPPPPVFDKPMKAIDVEVTSITDEEEDTERQRRFDSEKRTQTILPDPETMVSSYTTGGENDVIEIHQFSISDLDVYLDIYFETLTNRLRHYVGQNEELQQFRANMKTRIGRNKHFFSRSVSYADLGPFFSLQ